MDVSSGTEAEALELVDLTEVIVGLHEGRPLIVPRTVFALLQRESETKEVERDNWSPTCPRADKLMTYGSKSIDLSLGFLSFLLRKVRAGDKQPIGMEM